MPLFGLPCAERAGEPGKASRGAGVPPVPRRSLFYQPGMLLAQPPTDLAENPLDPAQNFVEPVAGQVVSPGGQLLLVPCRVDWLFQRSITSTDSPRDHRSIRH
jgi:hypothetical protein